MVKFNLVPFNPGIGVTIHGSISMQDNVISLTFELNGDIDRIQWPALSSSPKRTMDLWQATCFELFISNPNEDAYHEFNLSPSGNWYSFRFSGYRADMTASDQLRLNTMEQSRNINQITIHVDIECLTPGNMTDLFQVGLSTVLLDESAQQHYFALGHKGAKPDFHCHRSHLVKLSIDRSIHPGKTT